MFYVLISSQTKQTISVLRKYKLGRHKSLKKAGLGETVRSYITKSCVYDMFMAFKSLRYCLLKVHSQIWLYYRLD